MRAVADSLALTPRAPITEPSFLQAAAPAPWPLLRFSLAGTLLSRHRTK
jgi:hypothetical protein